MDKKQTFMQFNELSELELNQVTGGDWWSRFLNSLIPGKPGNNVMPTKSKIG